LLAIVLVAIALMVFFFSTAVMLSFIYDLDEALLTF
jgi:hypothetical protein